MCSYIFYILLLCLLSAKAMDTAALLWPQGGSSGIQEGSSSPRTCADASCPTGCCRVGEARSFQICQENSEFKYVMPPQADPVSREIVSDTVHSSQNEDCKSICREKDKFLCVFHLSLICLSSPSCFSNLMRKVRLTPPNAPSNFKQIAVQS